MQTTKNNAGAQWGEVLEADSWEIKECDVLLGMTALDLWQGI